ncbi:POC5 [Bugula neritina]|uniref:Centrosomal protein POC5 n=1 Tax=Bugula neritina TaxID=10212 RepID=A0A7J7JR89_BUGNE|nr:POC5 [Bugula neritina]
MVTRTQMLPPGQTVRSVELAPSASDLSDIERKLDLWSRQLNSNIIDEISRLRIKLLENARHKLQTTESRHAGEINTMYNELEGLKELLHTYEVSIERKDGVISNLTRSLQNQKEKFDTMKTFTDWKLQFAAKKQEVCVCVLTAALSAALY